MMIDQKERVLEIIKRELELNPEILFAHVFGSFIEPDIIQQRDIDIGVFIKDFHLFKALELEVRLSEGLTRVINKIAPQIKADVVVINRGNTLFLRKVITGRLLFTKDEDLWADFVTDISMKGDDILPLYQNFFKEAYIDND